MSWVTLVLLSIWYPGASLGISSLGRAQEGFLFDYWNWVWPFLFHTSIRDLRIRISGLEDTVEDGVAWWLRTAPRYQISNWLWFRDDTVIVITFLLSFRHGLKSNFETWTQSSFGSCQGSYCTNTEDASIQWNVPLLTCLRVWFMESTHVIRNFGSKKNMSNNRSLATLWVLETCLRVGLLPLMVILITASSSSKMYKIAPLWEEFTFWGNKINSR